MKRHTLVSGILNVALVAAAIVAWVHAIGESVSIIDIVSLLGVIAFSLMFVHYAADAIAPKQDDSHDLQYVASRLAVLVALLAHPILVNIYLITNGYGFPPDAYVKFTGSVLPVFIAYVALTAFIAFELRGKLKRFERIIFHANILAMLLILMHGFFIGMVMMQSWFVWVWWLYLISFTVIAIRRYMIYYGASMRKWLAVGIVAVLALISGYAGVGAVQHQTESAAPATSTTQKTGTNSNKSPQTPQTDVTVSSAQLATSNGLNGAKCWVAVDGIVYDTASSSEWRNGEHTPSHGQARCGQDLSEVIKRSPHGKEVLGQLNIVGRLEQ